MTPRFRKVALLAASLGLLLSLFLALRPQDEETATTISTQSTAAVTTAPATTAEPPPPTTAAPKPPKPRVVTIQIVVEGGRPVGGIRRATVEQGRNVVLTVVADVSDHVHLHGYDVFADVEPGASARLAFKATLAGRFEVELEERGVLLADLEVRP